MESRFTRRDFLKFGGAGVAGVFVLGSVGCGDQSSSADFPDNDLTIVAAGEPGGGLDIQARIVEEVMQREDLLPVGLNIENLGGGGGNPARATVLERPNNGATLVLESNRVFLSPLTGTTDMTVASFTPVVKLTTEYLVWAVQADSNWESATEILEAAAQDPQAVSFGVGTVPSDDQFNVLRAAQESGVEDITRLNVVAFESGGDLATNLVGGNVDVVSTGLSEIISQVEAGDVRLLSVSAPEPQAGATEGVPTWRELGIDLTLDHWRGLFGPADMPQEALRWWSDTLRECSETSAWDERVSQQTLTPDLEGPEEFARTISEQQDQAKTLIRETGLGNQ